MSKKLFNPPANFRGALLKGNYASGIYECGPVKISFRMMSPLELRKHFRGQYIDVTGYTVSYMFNIANQYYLLGKTFTCTTFEEFANALESCISLACEDLHNHEQNLIKTRSELVKFL